MLAIRLRGASMALDGHTSAVGRFWLLGMAWDGRQGQAPWSPSCASDRTHL